MITIDDILHDTRSEFRHDPWGSTLSWLFAIADYLIEQGEEVPQEWDHCQGIGGADTEDYNYQTLEELKPPIEVVHRLGAILWRFRSLLLLSGKDY